MDDNSLPLDLRVLKKKLGDEGDSNASENEKNKNAIESASAAQSVDNSASDNLEIVDNEIETEQHEVDPEGETSQGEKLLVCPTCSKTFKGQNLNYRLKSHMRTHTSDKPFKCKFCDCASAYAGDLARHERIHSGDRPFECKICGKKFTVNHHLTEHVRIHTGEKPYQCPECDDRFIQPNHLHEHMKCCTGTEAVEAGPSTSSSNQKDN